MSRTREAVALQEKARQDLEASRRAAEFNARQSYLNVTNGLAQVKALEQALVSSETALQSNRVGYEVGVRINIDVLNAQQQVFQTKRDLARARYDTILNGLRLKSAAGVADRDRRRGRQPPARLRSAGAEVERDHGAARRGCPHGRAGRVRRGRTDDRRWHRNRPPTRASPKAKAPKADAPAPDKSRADRKTTKAESAKKTASRAATKSKAAQPRRRQSPRNRSSLRRRRRWRRPSAAGRARPAGGTRS